MRSLPGPERARRACAAVAAVALVLAAALPAAAREGNVERVTVHSRALEGNRLGDSADRSVLVYLPPSYASSPRRRYPVVYLLHGVGDSNADWLNGQYQGLDLAASMNRLVDAGDVGEMILVLPDARNALEGCFYTNSVVAGNWEDFVASDLVRFVDATFRTLARPESRGIAGHSMGGYGAVKIALKHPDVFGAVYALSPCCLEWDADLSVDNPSWPRTLALEKIEREDEVAFYPKLFISMATAFSPNLKRPPFFVDFPVRIQDGKVVPSEPAYSKWSANLLRPMLGQYRTNAARLAAIRIDYGRRDQFPHIPAGCRGFSEELTAQGIPHTLDEFDGDHFDHVRARIETKLLPFFSSTLRGAAPAATKKQATRGRRTRLP